MKQKELPVQRDYWKNPRSYHEPRDRDHDGFVNYSGATNMTKASEAEACDINNIMKRYEATGYLPQEDGRQPIYGDFSTMETYHEAMGIVANANQLFYALPAEIRARFQNDPAKLLDFVERRDSDPDVARELIKMGLAEERKPLPETTEQILSGIRENTKATASKNQQQPDSTALKGE